MLSCLEIKGIAEGTIDISDELLLAHGIRLVLNPMAYEIKGLSFPRGSWYHIEINSLIPLKQQWVALLHELCHIAKNDFTRDVPVNIIEAENDY
jgi:hypothetical protein